MLANASKYIGLCFEVRKFPLCSAYNTAKFNINKEIQRTVIYDPQIIDITVGAIFEGE